MTEVMHTLERVTPTRPSQTLRSPYRLDPKHAETYGSRGLAYSLMGHHDKAITDLTEAIRLDPKLALASFNRGVVYGEKGESDKAIAGLHRGHSAQPEV